MKITQNALKIKNNIVWWRLLITTCLLILGMEAVMAVPAIKRPITITQKDGTTLTIIKHGDEFVNWTTTTDGYDIAQKEGIYYYASIAKDGSRQLTPQKVSNLTARQAEERTFLSKQQKSQMALYSAPLVQASRAARAASDIQLAPFPNRGTIRSVVILVQYQDVKFITPATSSAFNNQLNQTGYSVEGAVGCAKEYFVANSGGQMTPQFDVVGPYTLSKPMEYYGGNNSSGGDQRPQEMISESCELAAAAGVDFSQYDYDNDGVIDNVFVYYAGFNEAEGGPAESIWPHRSSVSTKPLFSGKKLSGYACTSELRGAQGTRISGIGTFCHEFGHVFGLVDFYDTNYFTDGYSYGLGDYDVMSSGSYNKNGNVPPLYNAIELQMVGWATEQVLDLTNLGTKEIQPIQNHQIYRVNTDVQGEYFLIENRQKSSNIWDSEIPGSGLMITHIDKSAQYIDRWYGNRPNYDPNHECAKFVYANVDRPTTEGWDMVPFTGESGNNAWGRNTEKRAQSWKGNYVGLDITNITKSGNNITFTSSAPEITKVTGKITSRSGAPLAGAEITLIKNQGPSLVSAANKVRSVTSVPGFIYTATSGADGSFEITNIADGAYVITVNQTGYVPYAGNIEILKSNNNVNIALTSLEETQFSKLTYQTGRYHNNLSAGGESFGLYSKYTAASLRKYIGTSLRQVSVFSTFNTDMQLRIYNNTDEAPIYTRDITVTEAMQAQYTSLDFNEGEIVIEPGKDYIIGFEYSNYSDNGTGSFDDDTSLRYEGVSNLISLGGWWGTAYWATGTAELGNYMLDVFFGKDGALEKPTAVSLPATSELNMNFTTQLSATFTPATASQYAVWNSSNVDVARVDENGLVTAISEGTTTITATSILDATILSNCQLTVKAAKNATLTGKVVDENGAPVAGATLEFVKNESSRVAAYGPNGVIGADPTSAFSGSLSKNDGGPLRVVSYAQEASVRTNAQGEYTVSTLEANASYKITITPADKSHMAGSGSTAMLPEGSSTINFTIRTNPAKDMAEFKYHNNTPSYEVGNGSFMNFMIAIDSTTFGTNGGKQLAYLELNLGEKYMNGATSVAFYHESDMSAAFNGAYWIVPESGKVMIDLSTLPVGMVTLPKDEKLYVLVIAPFAMMMDKSTPAVEGYGNLIFGNGGAEPISRYGDYPGNWDITSYFKDKAPILVESIEVSSSSDAPTLPVGLSLNLKAKVSPITSDYRHVIWSSSDTSIATVDSDGKVTGVGQGSVTITAKSKDTGGVVGTYTLAVELRQALHGTVKDSQGAPAAGAVMTFTPIQRTSQSFGQLSMQSFQELTTKSTPITTNVEPDGTYTVDIPEGEYRLLVTKEGCADLKQTVAIIKGLNSANFTMLTNFDANSTVLTYCGNDLYNGIANGGDPFTVAAKWTKDDLKQNVGQKITRLRYAVLADNQHIELLVFADGDMSKPLFKRDVPNTTAGWNVVNLEPSDYITIPEGVDIYFGYHVIYHDNYLAALDNTPAVNGKGNLINLFGDWVSASDYGLSGNWQLAMYLQTGEQIDGITIKVGQETASLAWGAATYTSFRLSYGITGEALGEAIDLETPTYSFTNLQPGQKYTYRIEGSSDGVNFVEMFTKEFTTKTRVTDIPAINIDKYDVFFGTSITLDILNTLPGDVIVWKIDGQVVTELEVELAVGEHEIRSEVKRGTVTYVTKRYVMVKELTN